MKLRLACSHCPHTRVVFSRKIADLIARNHARKNPGHIILEKRL